MRYSLLILLFYLAVPLYGQQVVTIAGVLDAPGAEDGAPLSARFNNPHGIATDSVGHIYIADRYNHVIRKVSVNGQVSTLAGVAGEAGDVDGAGDEARFNEPWGLCAAPDGTLYIADTKNNKIRRISPQGEVSTYAGSGNYGVSNGAALSSTFGNPTGIERHPDGRLYVADHLTHIIREISTTGIVSTLAGTPYIPGAEDGIGSGARFWRPYGLTIAPNGDIIVADEWNHRIRRINPDGVVTTLAGNGEIGYADGPGNTAQFNYPWDVTFDAEGQLFVTDGYNHLIRFIDLEGNVSTYCGTPQFAGATDGYAEAATFSGATAIAFRITSGTLVVADAYNDLIREVLPTDNPTLSLLNTTGSTNTCEGGSLSYVASPGQLERYQFYVDEELIQDSASPSFSLPTDLEIGTHTLYAVAWSEESTVESITQVFQVLPPPTVSISIVGDTDLFPGDTTLLIANGSGNLLWNTGSTNPVLTVAAAGSYTVVLTNDQGCSTQANPIIISMQDSLPTVEAFSIDPLPGCHGSTLTLASSRAEGNQWYFNGFPIIGASENELSVTEAGIYQIQYTAPSGLAVFSDTLAVSFAPYPLQEMGVSSSAPYIGDTLTFFADVLNETSLEWDFGDPNSGEANNAVGPQAAHIYEEVGDFVVTLFITDASGCDFQSVLNISVQERLSSGPDTLPPPPEPLVRTVDFPNAFTPNGDDLNDTFSALNFQGTAYQLTIFNQWGELLFFSTSPDNAWDGNHLNQAAPMGTYSYLFQFRDSTGQDHCQAGHITLIR